MANVWPKKTVLSHFGVASIHIHVIRPKNGYQQNTVIHNDKNSVLFRTGQVVFIVNTNLIS